MALPPLSIQVFGPLRVTVRGEPLPPVRTRSVGWLLALLTLRHGRAVSRSWLAGTLWPESSDSQALENLRADLVRLRNTLGAGGARLQSPAGDLLTLDLCGAEVDGFRFDRGVQAGDEASLREAVEVYTGPLLEGCVDRVPARSVGGGAGRAGSASGAVLGLTRAEVDYEGTDSSGPRRRIGR